MFEQIKQKYHYIPHAFTNLRELSQLVVGNQIFISLFHKLTMQKFHLYRIYLQLQYIYIMFRYNGGYAAHDICHNTSVCRDHSRYTLGIQF